jgi:prepilin-type N-terminal cleavage/methylation domain-containing protein
VRAGAHRLGPFRASLRVSGVRTGRTGERGLTLIEIMVAVMLVTVVLAVAVPAFNAATDSDLNAVAVKISGASRAAYGEAAIKNVTLRVAYDLDAQAYWVEAFPGTFQIIAEERDLEEVRDEEEEKAEDDKRKKELEDRYAAEDDTEAATLVANFVPVQVGFVEAQQLPRRLKIKGVRTPQFRQVVTTGKAYTHFFPNGWAERTLVYLEDTGGSVLTLETQPISGRVIVHEGELDWTQVDDLRDQREQK